MFRWLFRRPRPGYAVYVDYGVDGLYRPRIVRRGDPGIDRGEPVPVWMLPIASKFARARDAVSRIAEKLEAMGLTDYPRADVFAEIPGGEDDDGNMKSGGVEFKGTIEAVLAR